MSEQRKQILQMLADGKINADEAERLLTALESGTETVGENRSAVPGSGKKPKFLHIKVTSDKGGRHGYENVDIKVPIMLLKAGMKLGSLMPEKARDKFSAHLNDKGIDLDMSKLGSGEIDLLVQALSESSIDIDADNEKVRIFCA